mmetsp:Transcript_36155/g.79164  ORF Transcript_36155/g.79164 Transcript_36155/m.79164 type:complete len:107 (-) Transcript_36155:2-322(-)
MLPRLGLALPFHTRAGWQEGPVVGPGGTIVSSERRQEEKCGSGSNDDVFAAVDAFAAGCCCDDAAMEMMTPLRRRREEGVDTVSNPSVGTGRSSAMSNKVIKIDDH